MADLCPDVPRIDNPGGTKLDYKEITIKSAKGLPNISEYLKDNGLIKIGGPRFIPEGEIDAGERIKFEGKL